jgi:hypothetical protein
MSKKNMILKAVLPVSMALAVVGSGYGVWFFNETSATNTASNLKLTPAVTIDGLKSKVTGDILLDQSEDINKDNPNLVLSVNYTKILELDRNYSNQTSTYSNTPATMTTANTNTGTTGEGVSFTYNFTAEIKGGLETYIAFTSIGTANMGIQTSISGSDKYTGSLDHTAIFQNTSDNYPIKLTWKNGYPKNINSFAEYQKLYDIVGKSEVLITTTIDKASVKVS